MEPTSSFTNAELLLELHEYLRQLVSPEAEALRGEPDFARVEAYWHLGRIIVETEQQGQERADYGVHLIEELSNELTKHYGKGYKTSNLWWFKQFYLTFPILHAVRGEFTSLPQKLRTELTWTHYRLLISLTNEQERHFYLHNAADEKWSYRTLNRLIKSRYYYQIALGDDQLLATLPTLPKKINQQQKRRSRIAQARRALLDQFGWALVDRLASRLPINYLKPDALFFHYALNRFVGLWVGDANPALLETIRRQLSEWQQHPGPVSISLPLGMLLTDKNALQLVLTANTPPLSPAESTQLPTQL